MKKQILLLVGIIVLTLFVSGCMSNEPGGTVYANMTSPMISPTGDTSYTKVGTASTHSILYLFAWGDGGLVKASKNGNIKKIKMVDMDIFNILGLYIKYTTQVYGD